MIIYDSVTNCKHFFHFFSYFSMVSCESLYFHFYFIVTNYSIPIFSTGIPLPVALQLWLSMNRKEQTGFTDWYYIIMKKVRLFTGALMILLALCLISGNTAYAVNEDPGAGRLSGTSIPDGFYDTEDPEAYPTKPFSTITKLQPYGSFNTTNPYTGNTYSHNDIFSDRTIVNGIDVSQWQGEINWKKVKKAGIDFALIRVGYRGYGSGLLSDDTLDTYYHTNMENAAAAGVQVGIYVYSQAITKKEAIQEANYILDRIGDYEISMPLVLDYEYASTESGLGGRLYDAHLTKKQATNICLAFCETIEEAGYTPMVYANKSMLESQLNANTISKSYRIWLANYTTETTYGKTYDFWQYSSTGAVNGINGNVDMNFYYEQPGDSFKRDANSIANAKVTSIPDQPYTGKKITPKLTLTHDGRTLVEGEDYTLTYSDNKAIGTASIQIAGKNQYRNVRTVTFKIIPQTISSLKTTKRTKDQITISWQQSSNATGYQVYRATQINGKYKKIATISSKSKTTFTDTNLSVGTCYYYKVRAFKTVNGTDYIGGFSSMKALYTKTGYTKTGTTKKKTAVYKEPSTNSDTLSPLPKGAVMTITYTTQGMDGNTWYYVTCETEEETYKGYVPANRITVTMTGKVVKTKRVNVRNAATTSSKILTTLPKGKKVTVLKTKNKNGVTWYRVTFKKNKKTYKGWIASPYIKLV